MDLFIRLLLLALLALSSNPAPGHEECKLGRKVSVEGVHTLIGPHWVLVEGFANYTDGVAQISSASSSVTEISLNRDNKTFLFVERNIVNGKCLTYDTNMSAPDPETSNHTLHMSGPALQDSDGDVKPYDDQTKIDIYTSCPLCLTIIYHTVENGTYGKMLLFYRQRGGHQDVEELKAVSSHKETAQCLGFTVTKNFKYDGKAGFCEKKKKEQSEV